MGLKDLAFQGLARLWVAFPHRLRRQILFAANDHFLLGVVGVVRDAEGRILVLEHRFRTPWRWGLPGGFIQHGESMALGLQRELREEVGLEVVVEGPAIDVEVSANGRYVSAALLARPASSDAALDLARNPEIVGGGFFAPDALPEGTYPYHRDLIERLSDPERDRLRPDRYLG